jgi:hypothetical protein
MAKRTRAPARRKIAPLSTRETSEEPANKTADKAKSKAAHEPAVPQIWQANLARKITYTPELLAHARHRFEQTDDSVTGIALDLGLSREGFRNLAKREGWKRYVRPPRGLPASVEAARPEPATLPQSADGDGIPPLADTIARLHRAVVEELSAIEVLRMQPRSARSFSNMTRTLVNLTETLQKLQRLQPDNVNPGPDDDDMPADIDEFRNEIARRIEAFIAGWNDPDAARTGDVPSRAAEV